MGAAGSSLNLEAVSILLRVSEGIMLSFLQQELSEPIAEKANTVVTRIRSGLRHTREFFFFTPLSNSNTLTPT